MNIDFFNLLLEKLNVDSMRSIYLNAVPARRRARIDILELDKIEEKFSEKLFENLFSKDSFEIKIKLTNEEKNEKIEKQIQYLYNEEINIFREEGISSFSIGYPIFVKQSSKTKSFMKSPLFIWKLNIKRSKTNINEFIISKDADSDVKINKVLLIQLLSENKMNFLNIFENEINKTEGIITFENIKNIIENLKDEMKLDISEINEFKLEKFPDSVEEINKKGEEGAYIFQGAVLGLFKRQNEGIIQDFNTIKDNFDKYKFNVGKVDDFQLIKNTSISTDSSQQNVIETLTNNQYKIIQGPPGTGKSQTLSAIITNCLENGANILIVCEKKTALDVIYEKLVELELDDFVAILSDVSSDRKNIVKRVREFEENINKKIEFSKFDKDKYIYSSTEYKNLKEKYKNHQKLLENTLSKTESKMENIVLKFLDGKDYKEYYFIDTEKININGIYKILDLLNAIVKKIGSMEKFRNFEKIYNEKLKNISSYEIFFSDIIEVTEDIKNIINYIEEGIDKYGTKFEDCSGVNKLKVSLFFIFNHKLKDIKTKWMDIGFKSIKIDEFNKKYTKKNFSKYDYKIYLEELNQFHEILSEIEKSRQEFSTFINYKKEVEINKEDEAFINNFSKYIEDNKIENKEEFLISSYNYSIIQSSNLKLDKYSDFKINIEKIIEHDKYIRENQKYRIKEYWHEIRKRAILNLSQSEEVKVLYNLRKNAKYGKINTLREIICKDSSFFKNIFTVIMTDPNTCSSVFPLEEGLFDIVIFDEASQLKIEEVFPSLMRGKYKIVSGDIHQMPPSNYFGMEMDSNNIIDTENIDDEMLFLADSESLLDYANNLNSDMNMSYLDFHYRSKHPKLINFSNAAFYESRLVPMPAKKEYKPIEYYDINGKYSGRKNDDEADKIVEYIFSDNVVMDNKILSVGIVTLNLEQKKNILDKINSYLNNNDNERNRNRYNDLVENNFFVKNLENVQGDERDIMILSTTFGKNEDDKFIQNFGPLNNTEKGYKLLNVLVTRAKYKFVVFTSIPEENINIWEDEITKNGNNGKGIFYAYLAYAKSISSENIDMENIILNKLSKSKMKNINATYDKVEKEDTKIVNIIKKEIFISENDEIIKNYKIGGFNIDYAIKEKDSENIKIIIELNKTDKFLGETSSRSIIYRKGIFEGMGYTYKLLDIADYI